MSAVPAPVRDVEDMIPADCHGMNFYESDPAFRILLNTMAPDLLGIGTALGSPRRTCGRASRRVGADRRSARAGLHPRDSFGRDSWIEYHPSYRHGEDRFRRMRTARDEPSAGRPRLARADGGAYEIRGKVPFRSRRVRADVPGQSVR